MTLSTERQCAGAGNGSLQTGLLAVGDGAALRRGVPVVRFLNLGKPGRRFVGGHVGLPRQVGPRSRPSKIGAERNGQLRNPARHRAEHVGDND